MPTVSTHRARRRSGFSLLALGTSALTLVLVAVGGAVRATGSGLACPDWPFCYGKLIPLQADIPPETGYTLWNVWLEHSHRLIASVVGLLIIALAVWAIARYRQQPKVLWPTVVALIAVNVQGALGALVVLRLLRAELVTAHLGMAMVVVACLVMASANAITAPLAAGGARDLRFARESLIITGICYVQLLVGAHVTGVRAGLVYGRNPLLFDGAVFPAIESSRQAYHVAHRLLAYVLVGGVIYLCVRALAERRARRAAGTWTPEQRWLVKLPMWAATLVVVQIGIGFANVILAMPPDTVIPHLAVASWIWTVLVTLTVLAYRWAPRAADAPSDPERTGEPRDVEVGA